MSRGQGAFEYLLLLGGTVLVATVVVVMAQGSISEANSSFDTSSNDFGSYITGGVKDLVANGSLVHESPAGCIYNNPACDVGYYCNAAQNVCTPITSVQLLGYGFDASGVPLSGVVVNVTGGDGSVATTDASGRYDLIMNVSQMSALYPVTASRVPASTPAGATVNLTVGFATVQNFTLAYNAASLSGYVRDASSAGISGVNVSCGRYSTLSASGGAYSISNVPMSSDSVSCTLTGTKSPTVVPNSTPATLSAGLTNSKNLQLSYSSATLSGYIRNTSGSGINGALVSCAGSSATTSSNGSYVISGIAMSSASSTCTVSASKTGYLSNSTTVSLNAGTAALVQALQLQPPFAALNGYVRDSLGAGLNGAVVSCAGYNATTATNGSYAISNIPLNATTGNCTLAATKSPTYRASSATVTLTAGASASKNMTLPFGPSYIFGYVKNSSGGPVGQVAVSYADSLGGTNYGSVTTDSSGRFSIPVTMPAATLSKYLNVNNFGSVNTTYAGLGISNSSTSLTAGVNTTFNVSINYAPAGVNGRVVNAKYAGINGAIVMCNSRSVTTNATGHYSLAGIPMPTRTLYCTLNATRTNYTTNTLNISLSTGANATNRRVILYDAQTSIPSAFYFPAIVRSASKPIPAYDINTEYDFTVSLWTKIVPPISGTVYLLNNLNTEVASPADYRGMRLEYVENRLTFRLYKSDQGSAKVTPAGESAYAQLYGINIANGAWHHIAVTGTTGVSHGFFSMFVDGIKVDCSDGALLGYYTYSLSQFANITVTAEGNANARTRYRWYCSNSVEYSSTDPVMSPTSLTIGQNMKGSIEGLTIYNYSSTDAQMISMYTSTSAAYASPDTSCRDGACPVCYAGDEAKTTEWGAGLYGCSGTGRRCLSGSCISCGGWMNAGYCWYNSVASATCTSVCSTRGGVYTGWCDWQDPSDFSTCLHFYPGASLWIGNSAPPQGGASGTSCTYHSLAGSGGSSYCNTAYSNVICACNT